MTQAHRPRRRKHARAERTRPPNAPTIGAPTPTLWTRPLVAVVAIGALFRAYYLRQPMRYDESVTYLSFASQSWTSVVSSYTYPNNHVLHTLLLKACVSLLTNEPWVLRLPAFVAGVAMVPATYALGRRLFGSPAGHLGAALVSSSGALTFYSTNARGYTMICLATLVLANALLELRERSSRVRWSIVVAVTALGIWTVPVMLFPAGGLALWFVLSTLRGDTNEPRADLVRLGLALGATGVLAFLLYSPIIANEGSTALAGNSFVRSSAWRLFFHQIAQSVELVPAASTLGLPILISVVIGACAVAGLAMERKTNGIRVSMVGAMYVWCSFVLLATHRVPYVRVWLFGVAPVALLAGHGVMCIVARLGAIPQRFVASPGAISVGVAIALVLVVISTRGVSASQDTGTLRDAEPITKAFSAVLRPGDRVFAPIPSNAPLAYYFGRAGLDANYLSSVPQDSSRVFLVVNTAEGFVLGTGLSDPLLQRFKSARLVGKYPSAEIYQLN